MPIHSLHRRCLTLPSKLKDMQLAKLDDLFKSEEERQQDNQEHILDIPLSEVHAYQRQPYSIDRPTPDLVQLMDSITQVGIIEPIIVRPQKSGGYEIISGHRRHYCAYTIGLNTIPAIVRAYTDDEADILVVDYNITRENLLPSEKAKAFKLKLNAMKRQGLRTDLTSFQLGEKLNSKTSVQLLSEQINEKTSSIHRYIRLTKLIPALLAQVDNGTLKITPAADFIAFLTHEEQSHLSEFANREGILPSLKQAKQLKELSEQGKLTADIIDIILHDEASVSQKIVIKSNHLKKYFPADYSAKQMEDTIINLLEEWQQKRQLTHER